MRGHLDENLDGNIIIIGPQSTTLVATVFGDLFTRNGARLELNGVVEGSVFVEPSSRIVLRGEVMDNLKITGGEVELLGTIHGDIIHESGKLTMGPVAKVEGQIYRSERVTREAGSTPPA